MAQAVQQAQAERIWQLVDKVGVCMMTTRFSGGLRARPLEARLDRDAGLIWFLADSRAGKDEEIARHGEVGLTFIDPASKAYLSLTGEAEMRRDRAKAAEIWRDTDTAWWPGGADDPNVQVIRFEPHRAELWDGPASSAVAAHEFAKARATGEPPDLGENRKVSVRMD